MTIESNSDNPRRTALLALCNTSILFTRYCDRILNSRGSLSYQQFRVLHTIASLTPPVSQTDLAREIQRELNSVSMIIDRMETAGLVTRTRSDSDRRTVHLKLTRRGKNLLEKGISINEELVERLTSKFSETETENMIRLLTKLQQRITKELDENVFINQKGEKA
jgi:DNA-binding MarR family transcriptional regulator